MTRDGPIRLRVGTSRGDSFATLFVASAKNGPDINEGIRATPDNGDRTQPSLEAGAILDDDAVKLSRRTRAPAAFSYRACLDKPQSAAFSVEPSRLADISQLRKSAPPQQRRHRIAPPRRGHIPPLSGARKLPAPCATEAWFLSFRVKKCT